MTVDGGRFHGEDRTLEEVARYDLLIGVRRPRGGAECDEVFRKQLDKLKSINPNAKGLAKALSNPRPKFARSAFRLT